MMNPRLWLISRDAVSYTTILCGQLKAIEPKHYVARPDYEDLPEKHPKGFVLVGMAGVGKTVLMQRFALRLAKEFKTKPKRLPIPVHIVLRNWSTGSFLDHVYGVMSSYYPISRKKFDRWLRNNRLYIFADGLDECRNVAEAIHELAECRSRHPNLPLFLSSRIDASVSDLSKIVLSGMTEAEAHVFLKQAGASTEDMEAIRRMHHASQGNPLLLRLITEYARKFTDIDQFFESKEHPLRVIIAQAIEASLVPLSEKLSDKTLDDVRRCLTKMAQEMYVENTHVMHFDRVSQECVPIMDEGVNQGLLAKTENGFMFAHLLFQEYFARFDDSKWG